MHTLHSKAALGAKDSNRIAKDKKAPQPIDPSMEMFYALSAQRAAFRREKATALEELAQRMKS